MHVLVLTAAAGVPAAAVEAVVARLASAGTASGPARRLGPDAVELALPEGLRSMQDLRGWLPGIDANVVPAAGRRKRLLVADMDSTIIGVECIDELADYAGLRGEVAAITEAAMRGTLDFATALAARVALLRGLPDTVLAECYAARVRLNPGARVLVRTMADWGAQTALVSGGFGYFAARVAAAAGFAHHRANTLGVADGRLTGRVEGPVLGAEAKRATLLDLAAQSGSGPEDAVAVGDGANDLAMLAVAGLGVAYRAKPAVAAAADARLDHSDLTAVLVLQRIPRAQWVG